MQQLNRIQPQLPASAMQTYAIVSPRDTTVVAACEQVGCAAWRYGWDTQVDESAELGQRQAAYIRTQSHRTFREMRDGALTVFRFEPHQRCFAEHRTRPEVYGVRDGDWRGNPTGRRRMHATAADWLEDFGEHQALIADQVARG